MSALIRTQSVYDYVGEMDNSGMHSYELIDEETDKTVRVLLIDPRTYEDLGAPESVTVTVEPGDLLNKPEGEQ